MPIVPIKKKKKSNNIDVLLIDLSKQEFINRSKKKKLKFNWKVSVLCCLKWPIGA